MATKLNVPLPSKGLVVDRPAEYVDARSAVNIKNMEYNRSIIRKRYGSSALGSSLGERVMRYFELQVGSSTRLFRVGLTKVEVLNKTTGVWSSVATTPLTGSAADIVDYAFPLLSGTKIAVFTNGIDAIRKCSLTGNDAALGGSPPKAKYLLNFGPYLLLGFITNDGSGNEFGSRVQWCDTGLPETWSGGNANSQDLIEDPEDITGMGMVSGGFCTIHKPNSIYTGQLVTTSDVIRFDLRSGIVGAVSGATISNLPTGEQIYLGSDGIRVFNGASGFLIESPVQDEIRETINPSYAFKSQGIFVKELDEYWVCIATGSDTEPRTIYKYNYRTKQIYKDDRENLCSLGIYQNIAALTWADMTLAWSAVTTRWNSVSLSSLNPTVIFGSSEGVSSKRSSVVFSDNSTAIESVFDTKDFTAEDFGVPDIDVMMRWAGLEIWAKGDSMKVYYSVDSGSTWTLAATEDLPAAYPDDDSPINVWFDVVKSKIRFRFYNNTAGESFTLKKYQVEASAREARK